MNKDTVKTFLFYGLFAICMFTGGWLGFLLLPWYYGVIIGGSMFVLLGVAAFFLRRFNWVCIFIIVLNGFFAGIAVSTYYTVSQQPYDLIDALIVTGTALTVFLITAGMSKIMRTHPAATGVPLCLLILGVCIFLWAYFKLPVFAYATFAAIGFISFVPTLLTDYEDKDEDAVFVKSMLSSFTALIVIVIVVLLVLSEGEALELFAPDVPSGGKPKNKKPR